MNTNPMAVALRFLKAGPAMLKLREKTSNPMTFASGKLKEERTTIVEENIELPVQSWTEIGETGVFVMSVSAEVNVLIAAEDILMVITKPAGIV
jgi:hypothetical protein